MDRGSLEDGLGGGSLGGLGCRLKKFRVYVECGRGTITKYLSGCFDKNFTKVLKNFEADACKLRGAVMIAVCRGKISEGLDLSDRC
jgi:hypothetical protein